MKGSRTIGSPVSFLVKNLDNSIDKLPKVYEPRPGHADLSGILKYNLSDIRDVLERASARETVSRVAVGAICKILLAEFGITVVSHVVANGRQWEDVAVHWCFDLRGDAPAWVRANVEALRVERE